MIRSSIAAVAALCCLASVVYADDAKSPISGSVVTSAPIVFFDIAGPDAAKLHIFYSTVFGWSIDANNAIKTGKLDGTLRQDPPEKIIYVGVPDLNAAVKQVKDAGGTIDAPRIVIPNGPTFALFRDPAGNRMGIVETK